MLRIDTLPPVDHACFDIGFHLSDDEQLPNKDFDASVDMFD